MKFLRKCALRMRSRQVRKWGAVLETIDEVEQEKGCRGA